MLACPSVAMELPPYTEADNIEDGAVCYICKEFKAFKWLRMAEHIRKRHGVYADDIKGTFLGRIAVAQAAEERRERWARAKQRTAAVPPAAQLAGSVRAEPDGSSWKMMWVRVGSTGEPILPLQFQVVEPSAAPVHEVIGAEPAPPVHAFVRPTCKYAAKPLSIGGAAAPVQPLVLEGAASPTRMQQPLQGIGSAGVVANLVKALQHMLQPDQAVPQQREFEKLAVAIAGKALAWSLAVLRPDAKRQRWPLHGTDIASVSQCLIEFERFLRNLSLKQKTVEIAVSGTKYFLSSLTVEGKDKSLAGVVAAVYTDNIAAEFFDLPLMDPCRSWACKIVSALHGHLCPFLLAECGRKQHEDTARCIRQFQSEFLVPRVKACSKAKKRRMRAKKQEEAVRLQAMPPVAAMKAAATQAIVDLHVIARHCESCDEMSGRLQASATAAMVGTPWNRPCTGCSSNGFQNSNLRNMCRWAKPTCLSVGRLSVTSCCPLYEQAGLA